MMILISLTSIHVVLSLLGIGSGFVVVFGMLASKYLKKWTALFLATTAATSVTGFVFPFHHFLPSHGVGILSLVVLALAILAIYRGWKTTFAITSVIALYFNCFVLIVQLFLKVQALHDLAPTQSEPPFQVAQLAALVLFVVLGIRATMKFRSGGTILK